MKYRFLAAATAIALGTGLTAAPASAQIQFAVFNPVPSSKGGVVNFKEDSKGDLTATSASTKTEFTFDITPLANFLTLPATFDFNATQSSPATVSGGVVSTTFAGTFDYYYAGPTVTQGGITLTKGELLLGGTFANASFSGAASSSGGGLQDDSITGAVTYTTALPSSALPLASTGESFSLAFIELSPVLAVQSNGDLRHFTAIGQGEFSSNLTTSGGGGGTPEPATWALMLLGVAGVGGAMRRRRFALAA